MIGGERLHWDELGDSEMNRNSAVEVISNLDRPLGDLLNEELRNADEFLAATAFLNSGGLNVVMARLEEILRTEGHVSIVHGADFRITDPGAVHALVDMNLRYGNMSYRVNFDWSLTHRQRFHPKLYLSTFDYKRYCVIVGSSNLTLGGLRNNTEVNAVIRGDVAEPSVRECLSIYHSIISNQLLIEPDVEFAEKHAALHEYAQDLALGDEPPVELEALYRELEDFRVQHQTRRPRTQVEYIVQALLNLTGDDQGYVHLGDIYNEAERLARNAGQSYDWDTFRNSVRGRINEHVVGRGGRDLFERRGGLGGRFGEYRLSDQGRTYVGRFVD